VQDPRGRVLAVGLVKVSASIPDQGVRIESKGMMRLGAWIDLKDDEKGEKGGPPGGLSVSLPGAAFVVGDKDGVRIGGQSYAHRQVIVRNSDLTLGLAPPGAKLTIPGKIKLLGKEYDEGTIVINSDSTLPPPPIKTETRTAVYPATDRPVGALPREVTTKLDAETCARVGGPSFPWRVSPASKEDTKIEYTQADVRGDGHRLLVLPDGARIQFVESTTIEGESFREGEEIVKIKGWWCRVNAAAKEHVEIVSAKRARKYKQVDGSVVAPRDADVDVVVVIRIADMPPGKGGKMHILAGGRQYDSPYTFFPIGKSWQEIAVVMPKAVVDCELSVDGSTLAKFKADEAIQEELAQTID
jgi:hypothetical protein